MKILSHFLLFFVFLSTPLSLAGRPVFHALTRDEMIGKSDFIFSGWPSHQQPSLTCSSEMGRWQVHKVYRGDKSFEGKIISIANHGYEFQKLNQGSSGKGISYEAFIFRQGHLNLDQSTSFLFTKKHADGCFELVANGAQEHRFAEAEIEALLAGPKDCEVALRGFQQRVDKFPHNCQQDSDCDLFFIHPSSCERPFILSKKAKPFTEESEFLSLVGKVRSTCADRWKEQPACAPIRTPFRCKAQRCEEGYSNLAPLPKFKNAKVSSSCAPHDAASVMIMVTADEKTEYPLFSVNWWGEQKPNLVGGTFELKYEGQDPYAHGFTSRYCPYQGRCQSIQKIFLKLVLEPGKKSGTLDFSLTTDEKQSFEGRVPVKIESSERAFCG